MEPTLTPGRATRDDALAAFAASGCSAPRTWGTGPDERYGAHDHPRDKVLFCLAGSIVFHLATGDVAMTAGDRLDLPAGTRHAASAGPEGCSCVEAWGP